MSSVGGIPISHPERMVFPELGLTKLDVARYYDSVAPWMVPHLVDRPLTLLRCDRPVNAAAPKGGCQMMRHRRVWGGEALRRVTIEELRKTGEYLVADNAAALVSLAQMAVLEIHTWNAGAGTPYQHDRVVLDFDPGPSVHWREVVKAAHRSRSALEGVGLESFVKTTGGRGLHVVIPIAPRDWKACLTFARAVGDALVQDDPRLFTLALPKAGREDKILIDVLRNNRTNTSVSAYSLRARAGAPVSMPIHWDELTPRLDPARFDVLTARRRLKADGDAWSAYFRLAQRLPA